MSEVEENGCAFENSLLLRFSIFWSPVDYGRDTSAGIGPSAVGRQVSQSVGRYSFIEGGEGYHTIDSEIPVFFLNILGDVDHFHFILESQLFKNDAYFLTVGSPVRVEGDVRFRGGHCFNC